MSAEACYVTQDLGGEHLSDLTGTSGGQGSKAPGAAGYDGGGATAYPAEQSGKARRCQPLADPTCCSACTEMLICSQL